MKKLLTILFAGALILGLPVCVFADSTPKVVDYAGIFSDDEVSELEARCESIADTYGKDCVIYTDSDNYGEDHDQIAYDFYVNNGYGIGDDASGSIIYICMNDNHRYYAFAGTGTAESCFSSGNVDGIIDDIQDYMSSGYYYDAMVTYLNDIETMYSGKISSGNMLFILGVAAVVGVIAGLVVLLILYSGMNKVRVATEANDYVAAGSFKIRKSRDYYLYSTVTRVRRDPDSGNRSSGSSGGHSFSGGGHGF